ncbi:ECF transporter S component [bacterium]|nr:ECF transporter S component [bacterium]RQV97071.1 MAG: ECF transporter S component [bacterium]
MGVRTIHLTLSALFIAMGILIPILFHMIGMGSVFLPMFWPIAICGFFLPFQYAIIVGGLTPVLSSLMTGMPPQPILTKMIFELVFLAGSINLLYEKTRWGSLWIVFIGIVISRIVLLVGSAAIAPILGLPAEWYAIASLFKSIPGIIILLVVTPVIIKKIKGELIFRMRGIRVQSAS